MVYLVCTLNSIELRISRVSFHISVFAQCVVVVYCAIHCRSSCRQCAGVDTNTSYLA